MVFCVCVHCSGTRMGGLMDGLNTEMTHKSKNSIKVFSERGKLRRRCRHIIIHRDKNKLNLLKDHDKNHNNKAVSRAGRCMQQNAYMHT